MAELPVREKVSPLEQVEFIDAIAGSEITWIFWLLATIWLAIRLKWFGSSPIGRKLAAMLPSIWSLGALWSLAEIAITVPQIFKLMNSPGGYGLDRALADLEYLAYLVGWVLVETVFVGGLAVALSIRSRDHGRMEGYTHELD